MKFYKDKTTNEVFAFEEDGSQDNLIGENLKKMTSNEVAAHLSKGSGKDKTQFSSLEYLDRFTEAEQLAIAESAMTNSAVKIVYDRVLAAQYIDLSDARVALGLDVLVENALISKKRKTEILTPDKA